VVGLKQPVPPLGKGVFESIFNPVSGDPDPDYALIDGISVQVQ
jgi:hypothetical protein